MRLEHWRRPLKDGGVEFYFRAGDSKFSGSVSPARDVHGLMDAFETVHGVTLPDPEIKPMRGAATSATKRPDA
jgi:hypothetical protein